VPLPSPANPADPCRSSVYAVECATEMVEGQRRCEVKGPSNGEFDWPGQFGNYKSIATDALAGASHF